MLKLTNLSFPPTLNHRYIPVRGRLILSPEYRKYKTQLARELNRYPREHGLSDKTLSVRIEYVGPKSAWFTKSDSIRKIDIDNRSKSLLDGIFAHLDLDDSQVFYLEQGKTIDESCEVITCSVLIKEI